MKTMKSTCQCHEFYRFLLLSPQLVRNYFNATLLTHYAPFLEKYSHQYVVAPIKDPCPRSSPDSIKASKKRFPITKVPCSCSRARAAGKHACSRTESRGSCMKKSAGPRPRPWPKAGIHGQFFHGHAEKTRGPYQRAEGRKLLKISPFKRIILL